MIKKIIIYTRPWELKFHIKLAETLKQSHKDSELIFVTFFHYAYKDLIKKGYAVVYMPEEFKKIDELDDMKNIEKELNLKANLNLNLLAQMERFLPKCQIKANEFIVKHVMVLDKLVSENTLSISSMYDHFIYILAGVLANIRGGFHFSFVGSGVPAQRTIALKTPWETWKTNYSKEYCQKLLKETISKMDTPSTERIAYMKIHNRKPLYKRIKNTFISYLQSIRDQNRGNYFLLTPFDKLKISLRYRLRHIKKDYKFQINNTDDLKFLKDEYVFCPLHMEPEATILMYSPWLRNQIEMCRLISQALPYGVKLLVKENPKMKGIRPYKYYKELEELPNIVLVNTIIDSKELIDNSLGVITLAGTASLEASVLSKRNMCFAKPPYYNLIENYDIVNSSLGFKTLNTVFNNWLINRTKPISFSDWQNYINGTIDVNLVPCVKDNKEYLEVKSDEDTVNSVSTYINKIILA